MSSYTASMLQARMPHCDGVAQFEAAEGADVTDINDNRKTAYDQLCTSYHAIDDFRAKLLGFLPLVTGGGLILLTGRPDAVRRDFFGPVGLLGIAVTIGLLAYELNGVRRCRELIEEGKALEKDMELENGQFISRRDPAFSIGAKPLAAAWIYPAVLGAWTYLALFFDYRDVGKVISLTVLVAGLVGILLYDQSLREEPKPRWLFNRARRSFNRARSLFNRAQSAKSAEDSQPPAGAVERTPTSDRPASRPT
jgi:hypothetical protein